MMRISALICGFVCGLGFLISGLFQPSLTHEVWHLSGGASVYGAALFAVVVVAGCLVSLSRLYRAPLLGGAGEPLPNPNSRRAVIGALAFGLGWGVAGYFPMAALVAAGTLSPGAPLFLVSVLIGMVAVDVVTGKRSTGRSMG